MSKDMGTLEITNTTPVSSSIFDTPKSTDFIPVEMDVYSPTRLDYFATRILQGLVAGRSEKDIRKTPKWSVSLAKELVERLDSETG